MTDTLFSKFGETAYLQFTDSSNVSTTVIHRHPDQIQDIAHSHANVQIHIFEIRKKDIPSSFSLEKIEKDGNIYIIQGEPFSDQYGIVLKYECYML